MSKRAERKKRADCTREKYKGLICWKIQQRMQQKLESGYSEKAAFNDAIAEADIEIHKLIKQLPHDAHLIRQTAWQIKRDLEKTLGS